MFNFVNIVCQSWGEIHFVIGPPYLRAELEKGRTGKGLKPPGAEPGKGRNLWQPSRDREGCTFSTVKLKFIIGCNLIIFPVWL